MIIGLIVFGGGGARSGIETAVAERADVFQSVSETGIIKTAQAVDLTFGSQGRIESVLVEEGDEVAQGDVLARLSGGGELASLESARANLAAQEARYQDLLAGPREVDRAVSDVSVTASEATLEHTIDVQDQLVLNARRQLLSSDLQAYLDEDTRQSLSGSLAPPVISGTYMGDEEGEYILELYPSASETGYSFRLSGLERGVGSVATVRPEPLGNLGLYIQFPKDFAYTNRLTWIIPVPNTRSSFYSQNMGAYLSAERGRESAIEQAERGLELARAQREQATQTATRFELEAQRAGLEEARARLRQAQVAYENTTIVAPFSGVVSAISILEGEWAASGTDAVALIAGADYELILNVSETDIGRVKVGDRVSLTFDALKDTLVAARVSRIAPRAETINGVTSVRVTVQLSDPEGKIMPGFTADATIHTDEQRSVLTVPTRALVEQDGKTYVRIQTAKNGSIDTLKLVEVEVGLRGSGGVVEITSGISEGDEVVTFIPTNLREALTVLEAGE